MDTTEFANLKFGNVIQHVGGNLFVVTQVVRDSDGNATHIGITPALDAKGAADYSVAVSSHTVTYLVGKTEA